jgi:hypothetical protein
LLLIGKVSRIFFVRAGQQREDLTRLFVSSSSSHSSCCCCCCCCSLCSPYVTQTGLTDLNRLFNLTQTQLFASHTHHCPTCERASSYTRMANVCMSSCLCHISGESSVSAVVAVHQFRLQQIRCLPPCTCRPFCLPAWLLCARQCVTCSYIMTRVRERESVYV